MSLIQNVALEVTAKRIFTSSRQEHFNKKILSNLQEIVCLDFYTIDIIINTDDRTSAYMDGTARVLAGKVESDLNRPGKGHRRAKWIPKSRAAPSVATCAKTIACCLTRPARKGQRWPSENINPD